MKRFIRTYVLVQYEKSKPFWLYIKIDTPFLQFVWLHQIVSCLNPQGMIQLYVFCVKRPTILLVSPAGKGKNQILKLLRTPVDIIEWIILSKTRRFKVPSFPISKFQVPNFAITKIYLCSNVTCKMYNVHLLKNSSCRLDFNSLGNADETSGFKTWNVKCLNLFLAYYYWWAFTSGMYSQLQR